MSVKPDGKPDGKRQGHTKPIQVDGSVPRMPHERDESSDSHEEQEPGALMRKAHDDVAAGRVDTDRGAPMNEAYQHQKETPRPAPRKRAARPDKP